MKFLFLPKMGLLGRQSRNKIKPQFSFSTLLFRVIFFNVFMDKKREKIDFLYILASALNLYKRKSGKNINTFHFKVFFFGQNSPFLRPIVLVLLVFIVKGCLSEAPLLKLLAFCQYWILANLSLSPKIVGAQKFSKFLTRNHKLPPQELVNPPGHQLG